MCRPKIGYHLEDLIEMFRGISFTYFWFFIPNSISSIVILHIQLLAKKRKSKQKT